MIRIDHISFEFTAPDEQFAYGLHADWDGFCRRCFEQVVEECCAAHNKEKVLHEIERLELDLGSIPEEDFYLEFPRRLREELLKALPFPETRTADEMEKSATFRRDNLLFFLEHGFLKPEWADSDFNPSKEAGWLLLQSATIRMPFIRNATLLCLEREYALLRLLWQTDNMEMHLRIYTAALAEPSAGLQEKHRFLTLMLEEKPDIPVHFVHEAGNDGELHSMAALLDSPTVRQLMQTEMKEHAEVDLPPYWHYLYEWLIQYYPFNGLAMLGGKAEFTRHLHHRLLTFIRKRSDSPYLSKVELTLDFLLEVFGPAYYKEVLSAIYGLQPRHSDGSPVYDGYFNRELYRIFMQLSLLRLPAVMEQKATGEKVEPQEISLDMEKLTAVLKENTGNYADKRTLLAMVAKQHPEIFLNWLRSEALKDHTFISLLSELADDRMVSRLLATLSFASLETVEKIKGYLERQEEEVAWLQGVTEAKRQSVLRKAVLLWIAGEEINMDTLLRLIYQEVTGSSDTTTIESLAEELSRMETGPQTISRDENEITYIHRLQKILSDPALPETVKQRRTAEFWDMYKENSAEAIVLLQEQHLLSDAIRLTGQPIKEEIIRQLAIQAFGTAWAIDLLPLLVWLTMHEAELPHSQVTGKESLVVRLLLWLAAQTQNQAETMVGIIHDLLVTLWSESELSSVIKMISGKVAIYEEAYDMEAVFTLLQGAENNERRIRSSAFSEWRYRQESLSNSVQTLFEERWNTVEGFTAWLEDSSGPADRKRELLQTAVTENTQEWMALLRRMVQKKDIPDAITDNLPVSVLCQGVAKVNFYQASVLSQTIERIERHTDAFPFLVANGISLSLALSKALLFYMQDMETLERTLTERETIEKFLAFLYHIYTGQTNYRSETGWKQLSEKIIPKPEQQETTGLKGQEATDILSNKELPTVVLQDTTQFLVERQPEKLLAWLGNDAGSDEIRRMAGVTDRMLLEQWITYLPTVTGFLYPDAFRRLAIWLLRFSSGRYPVSELAATLFAWIKETDWKQQTPQQMEDYLFIRLYGGYNNSFLLPMDSLAEADLPEALRKRLLQKFLRFQPKELLAYIHRSVSENLLPLNRWVEWLDSDGWIYLATSLSLSAAELIRQVSEVLRLDEKKQRLAWSTYLTTGNKEEEWSYSTPEENIRSFVQIVVSLQGQGESEVEETVQRINVELKIQEDMIPVKNDVPESFLVENAGLCLLAPWFVRLFNLLGYLDEELKSFKNTDLKIRAVFLLQYVVYGEEREYRETELGFNRLLVGLPWHVSLPKYLPLTDEEKQTVESMVEGVKANWPQLSGTSVKGFRQSFIARSGTLEQQEERWWLSVEKKTHDILLEFVPWSFRQIRLPWLKKYIQVAWNEIQEFQ